MNLYKTYTRYRRVGMRLNAKIMEHCIDPTIVEGAAKLLGVLQGKKLLLESDSEGAAFMDFVLHDYQVNNQSAIASYHAQVGGKDAEEQALLDAWVSSYTSLFQVNEVQRSANYLLLTDVLNTRSEIKLVDIAFSETVVPGIFMFIRLVSFSEFSMTSGNAFVFLEAKEKHLMRRYKSLQQRVKSNHEAIQRFVAFFHLSRTDGIDVMYQ